MNKVIKKKELKLNLADYDYMDDMPPLGWIWEFERRSEKYRRAYQKRDNDNFLENDPSVKELVFINSLLEPSKNWIELDLNIEPYHITKQAPVKVINLKYRAIAKTQHIRTDQSKQYCTKWEELRTLLGNDVVSEIKNSYLTRPESPENDKITHYVSSNKIFKVKGQDYNLIPHVKIEKKYENGKTIISYDSDTGHPFDALFRELNRENIVIALIDVSNSNSAIREELEQQITAFRKSLNISVKRKPKKSQKGPLSKDTLIWKYALVIYDLIKKYDVDYPEITPIIYPKEVNEYPDYKVTKKVRSQHRLAEKLIEGDYIKYL